MTTQLLDQPLRATLRRVSLVFLPVLAFLVPQVASAAGGPSGAAKPAAGSSSSQGGQSTSSVQTPQPPPIPLDLSVFALCKRAKQTSVDLSHSKCAYSECDTALNGATGTPGPWTTRENCQLSVAYNHDCWEDLQSILKNFRKDLDCRGTDNKKLTLPDDGYYSVVFLNEGLETPTLSRVLAHDPKPEIYGNRVGAFDLYDLQLLPDFGIPVITHYQASTTPNGVVAQLPSVLAQVATAAKNVPLPPGPAAPTLTKSTSPADDPQIQTLNAELNSKKITATI